MCSIACSSGVDDADGDDRREVLGRPVLLGGVLDDQIGDGAAASRSRRGCVRRRGRWTPAAASAREHARQELGGDALVHEQRLGGVAHAGALGLGVEDDRQRLLEVGGGVDVDVAVAGGGVDDGHGGDCLQRVLEALAAARDDQVDAVLLGGELGELLAPAAGDEADAAVGQPGGDGRLGGDLRERGVGVGRRGGAAQDDRVARLQAQRGGVDGDVGARLVDDGDDAERHAHLAHVEAVGQAVAVDHLADGVGERGDLAHRARDRADARLVQAQAVEQRVADVGFARELHVALVGREDLLQAALERGGDRLERGVLDGGVGPREHARGALGRGAGVGDG